MHVCRWVLAAGLAFALDAAHAGQPMVQVVLVQPSGPVIPVNLLRLSIEFAAGVEGPVLPRLALSRGDGSQIQEPFLDQELWSPSGRVLTILMHPGRVKSGLKAREEQGPILSDREDVVLTLDGIPIKRWGVGPLDTVGPVPSAWKVSTVRVESKQRLVVILDGPIEGREADYLAVVDARDERVVGRAQLTSGETIWTFTPNLPWQSGAYALVARGTLEDPAGNRVGSHFETSVYSPPGVPVDVVVPFEVRSSEPGQLVR
jgi:hypothetical protein